MLTGRITAVNPDKFGFITFHNPGSDSEIRFDAEDLVDAEMDRNLVGKPVKFYKTLKPDGNSRATKVQLTD